MKFSCPDCGQKIEMESMYGGQAVQCPACGANLTAPVLGLPGAGASPSAPDPSVIQTLQSNIDRGSMTISEYMAKQQIEGVVDLQSTEDKTSASSILTAEQGRKYKLGDVVAAGGMGAILDAKDVNLRRGVAMKVMLEPDKAGKDQIVRFIQEAQVTSQLEHPSIVPVHELGVDASGNVFYTMKFVKGRSLKDILKGIKENDAKTISDYPLSHLLTIFQKVCDAMAFAHSKRVIHRDLKPENVMVGDYGEVQVMDWGLAKVLPKKGVRRQNSESRIKKGTADKNVKESNAGIDSVRSDEGGEVLRTMDGSIMGTPGFMSPEQALGKTDEIDERTDIYALGAILYNILTLEVPVKAKTLAELIGKVISGEIIKPTEYNQKRTGEPEKRRTGDESRSPHHDSQFTNHVSFSHCPDNRIPESLSAVAMKALEVEAHRRYQTVKLFQKEIEAYQGGFATGAEQAGTWKQFALFVKRNKGVSTAVVVAMVVLLTMGGIFTIRIDQQKNLALMAQEKAEKALADFKSAQIKQQTAEYETASVTVEKARSMVHRLEFDQASQVVEQAIARNPKDKDARLLRAGLRIRKTDYTGAVEDLTVCRDADGKDQDVVRLLKSCERMAKKTMKVGDGDVIAGILSAKGYTVLGESLVKEENKLFDLYQKRLDEAWPGMGLKLEQNKPPERGLSLQIRSKPIDNLSPLKGIPLTSLTLYEVKVTDISPLKSMLLKNLDLEKVPVSDITPVKNMPLVSLGLSNTKITDMTFLKGMLLKSLRVGSLVAFDLNLLKDMPLASLEIREIEIIDLTLLKTLPLIELRMSRIKIKNLPFLQNSSIRSLELTDLPINDLKSLHGVPLEKLTLYGLPLVNDISPLKRMPLTWLNIQKMEIRDLTPLKGMPLTVLYIWETPVSDLSPLKGMPLKYLWLSYTEVADLTPLKGLPLIELRVGKTKVNDLTPLKGMSLVHLVFHDTEVTDLTPLDGMQLSEIFFTPKKITKGMEIIRKMKTINKIGTDLYNKSWTPSEFWKKYDAGEFR